MAEFINTPQQQTEEKKGVWWNSLANFVIPLLQTQWAFIFADYSMLTHLLSMRMFNVMQALLGYRHDGINRPRNLNYIFNEHKQGYEIATSIGCITGDTVKFFT